MVLPKYARVCTVGSTSEVGFPGGQVCGPTPQGPVPMRVSSIGCGRRILDPEVGVRSPSPARVVQPKPSSLPSVAGSNTATCTSGTRAGRPVRRPCRGAPTCARTARTANPKAGSSLVVLPLALSASSFIYLLGIDFKVRPRYITSRDKSRSTYRWILDSSRECRSQPRCRCSGYLG